jgi:hypothetical protein
MLAKSPSAIPHGDYDIKAYHRFRPECPPSGEEVNMLIPARTAMTPKRTLTPYSTTPRPKHWCREAKTQIKSQFYSLSLPIYTFTPNISSPSPPDTESMFCSLTVMSADCLLVGPQFVRGPKHIKPPWTSLTRLEPRKSVKCRTVRLSHSTESLSTFVVFRYGRSQRTERRSNFLTFA